MNFKINNTNFKAKYIVHGKQTPQETNKIYTDKINRLQEQRAIATQAQEYLAQEKQQTYIDYLPKDTFVRFNTGILDGEGKQEDKTLNFIPFLSFETKSINEQINISKELGEKADKLKLSLDEDGKLDTERVDSWFENLIEFYSHQK